jgi:predicted DNA-binding transcriptional regulator YafY
VRFEKAENLLHMAMWMETSFAGISLSDIQQEYSVSRRTAERMRDSIVRMFPSTEEIISSDRTKRWRLNNTRQLGLLDVSVDEFSALNIARESMQREGLEQQARRLGGIEAKLRTVIEKGQLRRIDTDLGALLEAEGLAMRSGPTPNIDTKILQTLRTSVLKCEKVLIHYKARGSNRLSRQRVCPYGFLYGSRHYLVAFSTNPKVKDYRLYSLSNIERVEPLGDPFELREDFSLAGYAENSFGVFQGKLFDISLKFSESVAADAKEFRFHPSQKFEEMKDGSLLLRMRASGLRELAWHLFTWGSEVKVLKPNILKSIMEPIRIAISKNPNWGLLDG